MNNPESLKRTNFSQEARINNQSPSEIINSGGLKTTTTIKEDWKQSRRK